MWIITSFGFFSVVKKGGDDDLTIRSRVRKDLERLREQYLPELGPVIEKAGSDYPYRAKAPSAAVATAIHHAIEGIDYSNFKDCVATRQGHSRAHVYSRIWAELRSLESIQDTSPLGEIGKVDRAARRTASKPRVDVAHTTKAPAYGGVVLDGHGRVLLREPKDHFDGYVWTFPKGRPHPDETPEQAAVREVHEESGVAVEIVTRIPGEFAGGTTTNVYFLMRPVGPGGSPDEETEAVSWSTPDEARTRIAKTKNAIGRTRDLAVLDAALEVRARLHADGAARRWP